MSDIDWPQLLKRREERLEEFKRLDAPAIIVQQAKRLVIMARREVYGEVT